MLLIKILKIFRDIVGLSAKQRVVLCVFVFIFQDFDDSYKIVAYLRYEGQLTTIFGELLSQEKCVLTDKSILFLAVIMGQVIYIQLIKVLKLFPTFLKSVKRLFAMK